MIGGRLPADSREAAVTGEIISRIDTLNGLIQDLLLFARPPQPKPCNDFVAHFGNRGSEKHSIERNRYSEDINRRGLAEIISKPGGAQTMEGARE